MMAEISLTWHGSVTGGAWRKPTSTGSPPWITPGSPTRTGPTARHRDDGTGTAPLRRPRPAPPRRVAQHTPERPRVRRAASRPYRDRMQSYTIGQAARLLGVSPDTARRWADAGRVTTHRDETGRRLVDGKALAAFSVELARSGGTEDDTPRTSVRNAFPGIVTAIKLGDVAAQVEIQAGPHHLVSLLTREAVEELGLEVGMEATARVKSTNVHIDRA